MPWRIYLGFPGRITARPIRALPVPPVPLKKSELGTLSENDLDSLSLTGLILILGARSEARGRCCNARGLRCATLSYFKKNILRRVEKFIEIFLLQFV